MKNTIKFRKIILYIGIPCIFFVFFLFGILVYTYSQKDGFLRTTDNYNEVSTINIFNKEILAHQKFTALFMAKDNYLGILGVRFNKFNRKNTDVIMFRIKERGTASWYYQKKYETRRFLELAVYPLGFPAIENSQNKSYVIEIESLYGKKGDAIGISDTRPILISEYVFPKSYLTANKYRLVTFLIKKLENAFTDSSVRKYSIYFILSLILYFLLISQCKNYIAILPKKSIKLSFQLSSLYKVDGLFLLYFILIAIGVNTFVIQDSSSEIIIFLLLFWFFTIWYYRFNGAVSFLLSGGVLLVSLVLYISGLRDQATRASFWVYALLWIGVFQLILNSKRSTTTPKILAVKIRKDVNKILMLLRLQKQ